MGGMRLHYVHFDDTFLWHLSLFELNLAASWIILVMDSAKERRYGSATSSLRGWAQYPELLLSIIPHDALCAGFATLSRVSLHPTNITHGLLCFSYFLYHLWICGTHASIFDRVVPLALGWSYVWSSAKRVFPNDMINDSQVYSVYWVSKIKPILWIIFAVMALCVFSLPIHLVLIERICVLYLIITIK